MGRLSMVTRNNNATGNNIATADTTADINAASTATTTHECSFCQKHWGSSLGLAVHVSRMHNNNSNKAKATHDCDKCPRRFCSAQNLRNHAIR
jgi:hypothetical protein